MAAPHLTDEQLSAQLDRALGEAESAAADRHLVDCADCAGRRDLLRATSQAVASLPDEDLPRPLDLGFLHEEPQPGPLAAPRGFAFRVIHGRPPVWLPAAAAAAAVVVLAVTVAPRFIPAGGGASHYTAGAATSQTPAAGEERNQSLGIQPPAANSGDTLKGAVPGLVPPQAAPRKAVQGPDGSSVTILANPPRASSGHPVQVSLGVVAGPSGTALASQGMELFIGQGSGQERLAAAAGTAPQLRGGQELDLSAEWSAGALGGPPAAGAYTLVGRAFFAGGRVVEITLPFIVSP